MEQKTFFSTLAKLDLSLDKTSQTLHELAVFALETVNIGKTVGHDSPIQKLWNVVSKHKSVNQQAFMSWCNEFGMLRFVKSEDGNWIVKFSDKTKANAQFDPAGALEVAKTVPFWEFAKEPTPNTKPYNVFDALKNIQQQAKAAATGGSKGDKPKRVVEHVEALDVIQMFLDNPTRVREVLGLLKLSEEMQNSDRSELKAA